MNKVGNGNSGNIYKNDLKENIGFLEKKHLNFSFTMKSKKNKRQFSLK